MNPKLVLIACLFFVAAVYADGVEDIPEELEELRDVEEPIEDRDEEEANELAERDEDEDQKEEEMKMAAVKAAFWRRRRRRRRNSRRRWWNQRVSWYVGKKKLREE